MFDFSDRVLMLSGANGGIPRATARLFHELGASMVLSDLDGDALAAFGRELDPSGARVATAAMDVTDSAAVDAAASLCRDRFGGCDFVVTGAGLYPDQPIEETSDADWRRAIAVNLDGVFFLTRAMLPLMRDGGSFVHIASMSGHRGSPNHAHYASAKAAVLGFTRSLMREIGPRGLRANAISPGLIDTRMVAGLMEGRGRRMVEDTPLGRLGTPHEVATCVAFLCSDAASFVNGETLHVNGGLFIGG